MGGDIHVHTLTHTHTNACKQTNQFYVAQTGNAARKNVFCVYIYLYIALAYERAIRRMSMNYIMVNSWSEKYEYLYF